MPEAIVTIIAFDRVADKDVPTVKSFPHYPEGLAFAYTQARVAATQDKRQNPLITSISVDKVQGLTPEGQPNVIGTLKLKV